MVFAVLPLNIKLNVWAKIIENLCQKNCQAININIAVSDFQILHTMDVGNFDYQVLAISIFRQAFAIDN